MKKTGGSQRAQYGLFCVRKPEWPRFLEMMEDSDNNFRTWEKWNKMRIRTKRNLKKEGVLAVDVVVDLDEFAHWCESQELPKNSKSRARYVSERLREAGGMS